MPPRTISPRPSRRNIRRRRASPSGARLLEDKTIPLILSSGIPADRAPLGIEAMRHGKDFMSDKPGMTSLAQLAEVRRVQAETKRIYSICYSEHFETRSTVKAGELVAAGAIGKVVNTVGLGPHQLNNLPRPDWFYPRERTGGILDRHRLASVRAVPVLRRRARCRGRQRDGRQPRQSGPAGPAGFRRDAAARPATSPAMSASTGSRPTACRTGATAGSPSSAPKATSSCANISTSPAQPGIDHLFLVDRKGMHRIDCSDVELPYGRQLIADVLEPHRDRDAAGALLQGHGAGADRAGDGRTRHRV